MPRDRRAREPRRRSRRRVLRRWLWALATLALASGLALVVWWWTPPGIDFQTWRHGAPPTSWAALDRQRALWREDGMHRDVEHVYVPLERMPVDVPLAVLVNEDINFFGHGPVDWRAVREVVAEWWQGGRLRGASTLSQQLARCLFLSTDKTVFRKVAEARLAWWLERRLGKRRTLELYLNVVEFGPGLFGVEAAAREYLHAPVTGASGEGAAGLAAAIPSPGRDNPATHTDRWSVRKATIHRRMERATWLRQRLERVMATGERT